MGDVSALQANGIVPFVEEQLRSHQVGPGRRYWVLLSLREAESLRGTLHAALESNGGRLWPDRAGEPAPPLVALYTHTELLDSINYTDGSQYERDVVRECFRFISSETEYSTRAQHLLIRSLQTTEPKDRQSFFQELRSCRRRVQSQWEKTAVAPVLLEPNEFALFEHRGALCLSIMLAGGTLQ